MDEPIIRERLPAEMTEYYVDDWLFLGLISLTAGKAAEQHVHEYDHPLVVATGTAQVWADGVDLGDFTGPTYVNIKAGVKHSVLAKTDVLLLCAHNLRGEGYPALKETS